jgi:cytochrome P450
MSEPVPVVAEFPTARPRGCPFDPPDGLTRLRQEHPLRRLAYPDGHVGWLATSRALVRAVLADSRFSARAELMHIPTHGAATNGQPPPPGLFTSTDPPGHTRYRRLLTGQFTVRRMRQLTERVREITTEHLDAMERQGPPVDLVQAFALPIPAQTICELLGVPYADRDRFQHHLHELVRLDTPAEQRRAGYAALHQVVQELVRAKRAEPTDDLLSGLTTGDLTDEELTNIGLTLLGAGFETTANMLALGTFALLSHPDQFAALAREPELAERAVEELVRYLSVIPFTVRTALEDVELDGQLVRAGESVTVSIPAANRDPERFTDPDTLDLHRSPSGHVAFGHGIHQCLGQQLARVEMGVGYPALLERFPTLRLAVPPDEVPLRTDMLIYGVHKLPVTWETA